jgi:hypothetical protein
MNQSQNNVNIDEEELRENGEYMISIDIRQPSFIQLTGRVLVKNGQEIEYSNDFNPLNHMNFHYNRGNTGNPILVLDIDFGMSSYYPVKNNNVEDQPISNNQRPGILKE